MPIYEYQCQACDHKMEALQKMADDPLTRCPACEQDKLKKLISAAAFKLKGSGWYETDFKNNNKAPPSTAGNSESGGSGSPAKGSSEGGTAKAAQSTAKPSSSGSDKAAG